MIPCVVRNAVAIRRRQKFALILYMSLIFSSFMWMRKADNSSQSSVLQKAFMLGDNSEGNEVSENGKAGKHDFTEIPLQSKIVSSGTSNLNVALHGGNEVNKAVTSSPVIDKNRGIKFMNTVKESDSRVQEKREEINKSSALEKNVGAINKRVVFLPLKAEELNQTKDESVQKRQRTFGNYLANGLSKTSATEFNLRKTLKLIPSHQTATATNENGKTRSLTMAGGERTPKPFPDDNIQLARRQFRTSSSDLEHFVLPETNLIMDNISRTDIATFLGNPEKVEAITDDAGAVMKKLVTLPKFPHGSGERHGQMNVSYPGRLNIKSQNLVPRNKNMRHRQYTKEDVVREDEVRPNRTIGLFRLNGSASPGIPEPNNQVPVDMQAQNNANETVKRKAKLIFRKVTNNSGLVPNSQIIQRRRKKIILKRYENFEEEKATVIDHSNDLNFSQVTSITLSPVTLKNIASKGKNGKYFIDVGPYLLELSELDLEFAKNPKNNSSKGQFSMSHNSKTLPRERLMKISYSSDSELHSVERTDLDDAELVSLETPAADRKAPIVVHEPDRQAQLAAEALSTLPPSECCLRNWHVLPHNQKLGQDYLLETANAEQVSDYDETEAHLTQHRGQFSQKFASNITLLDYEKSGVDVPEKQYESFEKYGVLKANKNGTGFDSDFSEESESFRYSQLDLIVKKEILPSELAFTNNPNQVGGGRWVDEVWIPNTDLPSTSAFYFTTMPSYTQKPARQNPSFKIEDITARRNFPSRLNYFLRKLATRSEHKREKPERSQRGFILSGSRREQEDDFQTEQSPEMMRKDAKFPHQSQMGMMNLSPRMFTENGGQLGLNSEKNPKWKFQSYPQSDKSDVKLAHHPGMVKEKFNASSTSLERGNSAMPNTENVVANNSMKFLRRSVSPNRRKLSSNFNSTLLRYRETPVNLNHHRSHDFLPSNKNVSTPLISQSRSPAVEDDRNQNSTENEEIVPINYDDFEVKEVPLPFEAEPRYQIAFKKRTLLQWDYSRPAFFPWRGIPDYCSNYPVRFLKPGSTRPLLLVSFPGSGNTWLRFLTEALTGAFTGSFYADAALKNLGMWGETETPGGGTTILQKTHSLPQFLHGATSNFPLAYQVNPKDPLKVVLLMRSPLDAIIALRHYHASGHTGFGQHWHFEGKDWASFTSEKAEAWYRLYQSWLQWHTSDLLVLHYEEIKEDPQQEALRLLKFIEVPVDSGRLQCSVRYPEGRFKRPSYPKHMQGYTVPRNVSEYLQAAQRRINQILAKKNLSLIPFHLQRFFPSVVDTAAAFEDHNR